MPHRTAVAVAVAATLWATPALAAGFCSERSVDTAKDALDRAIAEQTAQLISPFDVLSAEKVLDEARFCHDSDDYGAFLALARNSVQRVELMQKSFTSGLATAENVTMVRVEQQALARACNELTPLARKRFDVGVLGADQLDQLRQACALLSR